MCLQMRDYFCAILSLTRFLLTSCAMVKATVEMATMNHCAQTAPSTHARETYVTTAGHVPKLLMVILLNTIVLVRMNGMETNAKKVHVHE